MARTEQGYLIHNAETGYPLTVGIDELWEKMTTGKYAYEGPATYEEAGNHYYNNIWVPGGHIVIEDGGE
jgi:hypothetical protein